MNNGSEVCLLAEVPVPLFLNDVDTGPLNMCSLRDRFIGRTTNITKHTHNLSLGLQPGFRGLLKPIELTFSSFLEKKGKIMSTKLDAESCKRTYGPEVLKSKL